jgi:tetratricopeptide (TPR) repeat protein
VDIMPTILSLAGKKSGETQGADLSEALASGAPSASPVQYSESFYPELMFGMAHLEGVRQDAWTYIRAPRPELYDRRTDPGELRNLLEGGGSSSAKARALELEAALTRVIEDSKRFASVAEANPLDPQTIAMLQALGYMGESGAPEDLGGIDPKDGIQIVNQISRGTGIRAGDCATVARSVVKRLPGYVQAWNILGECVQQTGDLEAAREAFLQSLARQPKQPKVYLQLGDIDFSQGRNESARRHYAQALELLPELVDANAAMGKVNAREGRWDEAIRWYKRAVDADPNRAEAYLQLAELYFRKGDLAEARSWYEKALLVEPGNYTYLASLRAGLCALRLGDHEGAAQHLRRASESEPSRWQPLYRLACAESQQGDVEAALRALQAAAAKGFNDVSKLEGDACLRPLAAEPRFQSLVRTMAGGAQR